MDKGQTESASAAAGATVSLRGLKESCPAFSAGCPYAVEAPQGDEKALLHSYIEKWKSVETKCPAFDAGCPFKHIDSLQQLQTQLAKLPPSHIPSLHPAAANAETHDADGEKAEAVRSALHYMHHVSSRLHQDGLGSCPVFSTAGCPFKSVCSSGRALIDELEMRQWSQLLGTAVAATSTDGDSVSGDPEHEEEKHRLSVDLKQGTWPSHAKAQHVQFVKQLLKGKVSRELYLQFLTSMYFVYEALESALEACAGDDAVRCVHMPQELSRLAALDQDLTHFLGPDWKDNAKPISSVQKYVARIEQVRSQTPKLLVAHSYTRYMGDLSGGQIMKRAVKRTCQLDDKFGTLFYEFPLIPSLKDFKTKYRAALDAIHASAELSDRLVEEGNLAYDLNIAFFEELDRLAGFADLYQQSPPVAVGGPSTGSGSMSLPKVHPPIGSGGQCPFAGVINTTAKLSSTVKTNHLSSSLLKLAVFFALLAVLMYFVAPDWLPFLPSTHGSSIPRLRPLRQPVPDA